MVREVLDIASRQPWGWPQWDLTDPEGPDLRRADVGPLTVVYFINRPRELLYVLASSGLDSPPPHGPVVPAARPTTGPCAARTGPECSALGAVFKEVLVRLSHLA